MERKCVTHHYACECREAQFRALQTLAECTQVWKKSREPWAERQMLFVLEYCEELGAVPQGGSADE
jgi:hypothetical protein